MNDSELRRILPLAEVRRQAPPGFVEDLWSELYAVASGPVTAPVEVDVIALDIDTRTTTVPPKRRGPLVGLAAAVLVLVIGFGTFLLQQEPTDVATPNPVAVCLEFREQAPLTVAMMAGRVSIDDVTADGLAAEVHALEDLTDTLGPSLDIGNRTSLTLIEGGLNQARIQLAQGDAAAAQESLDFTRSEILVITDFPGGCFLGP